MTFSQYVCFIEAIIDIQYPFKAVFTAGGPGSGKSYIANHMFSGLGFKFSNSDEVMKIIANYKANPNIIAATAGDKDYELKQQINMKSNVLAQKRANMWKSSGLPYVIDITGRDVGLVNKLKASLDQAGYDTYMVFVKTSLNTAMMRNKERANKGTHVADEDYLIDAWHNAMNNLNKFASIFGENLMVVENDGLGVNSADLYRKALKLLGTPKFVKNQIGKQHIQNYVNFSYKNLPH